MDGSTGPTNLMKVSPSTRDLEAGTSFWLWTRRYRRNASSSTLPIIGRRFNRGVDQRSHMEANTKRLRIILIGAIGVALSGVVYTKCRSTSFWNSSDPGEVEPVLIADRYIPAFTV